MSVSPAVQSSSHQNRSDTAAIAAAWVERLTSTELSAEELAELRAWITAEPANARAYDLARRAWVALPDTNLRRRRPTLRLVGGSLLTAVLALLLLMPAHHDYASAVGSIQRVALPDGTVAWLDSDSAIDLAYDNSRRTVRMARGRAAFEVGRDPARPFAVEAGDARISDIGTLFSVDRVDGLEVAVQHGAVEVVRESKRTRLDAGEQVRFVGTTTKAVPVPPDFFGWREKRLVFDGERLDTVLADLGRYLDGRVVLTDRGLGARRVSGTLFTDRPEEGLAALARSQRLTVHRLPWLILVSSSN